jgi:hypothetical protein
MSKKVLIGSVILERDTVFHNNEFQYAASFEELKVPKGEYPVYAYESEVVKRGDRTIIARGGYIGFEGTVLSGNIGNKPGEHSSYHPFSYDFMLADHFVEGHSYYNKIDRAEWVLRPEWGIVLNDNISSFDGKRYFTKDIFLKDGCEVTYME